MFGGFFLKGFLEIYEDFVGFVEVSEEEEDLEAVAEGVFVFHVVFAVVDDFEFVVDFDHVLKKVFER